MNRRLSTLLSTLLGLTLAAAPAAALAQPASAATSAPTKTHELNIVDSAWATERQPDTAQKHDYLSVTANADTTYLKFSGAALSGQPVESAVLELHVRSTTATKPGVVAYPTTSDWSSSTLTYANKPAAASQAVSAPSAAPVAGTTLRIPLDIKALSTEGSFSLNLKYVQNSIRLQLERSGAFAPKIVVTTASTGSTTSPPAGSSNASPQPAAPAIASPQPAAPAIEPAPRPAGAPMVFAHYFIPYPLSIDNKAPDSDYYARHYLNPDGENGKFASEGGLLRDRPLSPAVQSSSDWRVNNMVTEIRQAKSAGIDGWTLNLMSSSGQNWDAALNMMKAAALEGDFVVVPMIDGSSGFVDNTPAKAASLLSQLYAAGSAYEVDGQYMLSSFKAEGAPVSWWSQVISLLERDYNLPITFQAVFLNASDANMKAYASIADGYGNWGARTERNANARPDYDARAAAYDKTWMEPVAVQDVRYNASNWAESNNTASVRTQWARLIEDEVDYVQIVTWNDYSESTQIAPSEAHGTAFLDLTRYFTSWFHTGTAPAITSDEIVLTHRTQFVDAKPSYSQTLMGAPTLDGTSTPARNTVEAVVWLKSAATVNITVGGKTTSVSAPAGVSAHTVPLGLGAVSASIVRSGSTTVSLTSPHAVVSKPYVQDLQYYAASSW